LWLNIAVAITPGLWLHSAAAAPMPTTVDMRHFDTVMTASAFI